MSYLSETGKMVTKLAWWTLPPDQLILFIISNLLLLAIAGWLWRQGDHKIWYKLEEKYRREMKDGTQDQEKGDCRSIDNHDLAVNVTVGIPVPP